MSLDPGKGLSANTLTTADGRTLRYVVAGERGPTVVFEAGLGSCASMWVTTQRFVAEHTRTVSYDRAGHAGSTADTQRRTLVRINEDLHALIEKVSPGEPVVLVAHSWGGPIVRSFADKYPGRVAGVVLVDTSTTGNFSEKAARSMPRIMSVMRALHFIGLAKPLIRGSLFKNVSPEMSASDRAIIDRDVTSLRSATAAIAEAREILPSLPLMARWEKAGLPNVPVINVMGSGTGRWVDLRAKVIAEVQAEMSSHPQGECRVIQDTDHYVPQDKPRETAKAILDVVEKAQQR